MVFPYIDSVNNIRFIIVLCRNTSSSGFRAFFSFRAHARLFRVTWILRRFLRTVISTSGQRSLSRSERDRLHPSTGLLDIQALEIARRSISRIVDKFQTLEDRLERRSFNTDVMEISWSVLDSFDIVFSQTHDSLGYLDDGDDACTECDGFGHYRQVAISLRLTLFGNALVRPRREHFVTISSLSDNS